MERIAVFTQPTNPLAEAYRSLCINILARLGKKKIIEVTDVATNGKASMVIANLAVAMAQTGNKVLLIDCNLHNPKQHKLFELHNIGLTDCLMTNDVENYNNYVQAVQQNNLWILTVGTLVVNNPVETLLSVPMLNLLNTIRVAYDIVLLDVPPVDGTVDAAALGIETDGVLLVITNKKDKVRQVQKAKEKFIQAGVAILGCVLDNA